MTEKSASDVLRELLDERDEDYSVVPDGFTVWQQKTSGEIMAWEDSDGVLTIWGLTPEQAIAATLGELGVLYMRGQPGTDYAAITAIEVDGKRFERVKECELEHHDTGWVSCRECNTSWKNDRPHVYRRCPYCGAKVVKADD